MRINYLVAAGKGGARIVALIRAEEAVDGFYQVSHERLFEGYLRVVFGEMGFFLEPFCGGLSPKGDKIFQN